MTKFVPGDLFHGLEMLRRCGEGSYGEVWLCRDLTGSLLAVKLIRKERGIAELRGVTVIRRALPRHPGVLTIHHVGEDDDFLWYTMDAADNLGADLENYLPDTLENRLKREIPVDAVSVIKQLLEGVAALHAAGIVHRDIKPDNILFLRGRAVIGDIGMATPDISRLSLAGTLEFLPPEVRDGSVSPGSIGKGGDLYALGKVLYCIVSGNPPDLFPSLPTGILRSPLAGRLNHLACRVCDRRASVRLADEAEFRRELEKIELLADTPESTLEKLSRNRRFLVRAAAEIVLIAAGAALLAWSALRLLKPRTPPQKTGPAGPAPKDPDYPGKAATKLYRHSVYALTAQIPQEWLVFSAKALGENYAGDKQRTHDVLRAMGISEEGIALFRKIIEEKVELIFLSFREKSTDNITVRVFPVSPEARREFLSASIDEFRLNFARQLTRIFPAAKVAVYSADRIAKGDFTMLTVEYSVNREENRQKVVYFILKDHMIDFTLSAPGERYAEYMPAFDRMIESVKFDPASFVPASAEKPASPKPAAVPPAAEKPSSPKPASVPPAATKPASPKPAAVPPAAKKPSSPKPAAVPPAATKPASPKPAAVPPAATKPASPKPASVPPAAEKPASPKPAAVPPAAKKSASPKPASVPPAAEKPQSPKPASVPPAAKKPASPKPAAAPQKAAFRTYRVPCGVFSAQIPGDWIDFGMIQREADAPSPEDAENDLSDLGLPAVKSQEFWKRLCAKYHLRRDALSWGLQYYKWGKHDILYSPDDEKMSSYVRVTVQPFASYERRKIFREAEEELGTSLSENLAFQHNTSPEMRHAPLAYFAPQNSHKRPKMIIGELQRTARSGMTLFSIAGSYSRFHSKFVRVITENAVIHLSFNAENPEAYRRHLSAFDHMIDTLKIEKAL